MIFIVDEHHKNEMIKTIIIFWKILIPLFQIWVTYMFRI